MVVRGVVRRSAYHDSAALMRVQQALRSFPGIEEAGVVMATPANLELLRQAGLDPARLDTRAGEARSPGAIGSNDLVVMVRGAGPDAVTAALAAVDELLTQRPDGAAADASYRPRTVALAARLLEGANLALISVPGRFAAGVAREALQAGLHVMLFSDNVPLADEVELKRTAAAGGRLMMGPDCGTAILGGAALGFANRVCRGTVGIVGASGTGIQEIATLVHRFGGGVSQAIGTGGRDLSAEVGGMTARQAVAVLGRDPETRVVVVVSKPPEPSVAAVLLDDAASLSKPAVLAFIGAASTASARGVRQASTLEDAARLAVAAGQHERTLLADDRAVLDRIAARAREAVRTLAPAQRYLRGLMSGGTLAAEAVALLERTLRPLSTNVAAGWARRHEGAGPSHGHTILDLGDDLFTVGRLHPMLDMTLRAARLRQEAADPEVAVLLLDVVLGLGVHPDPAGALTPVIAEARAAARSAGRGLSVVASVCGTDDDPQGRARQVASLESAGVLVEESNARAALFAGAIAGRLPDTGALASILAAALPAVPVPPAPGPPHGGASRTPEPAAADGRPLAERQPAAPPVADTLLAAPPRVVNVGLGIFAESLRTQGVPVIDVDWQPPAGGDPALLDLLERLT
ncbi:MAG TPA: acyl-CoA synthetase FdrA [bacterium]|nr:acyl-CoA synthetase FdrA [bacterium]